MKHSKIATHIIQLKERDLALREELLKDPAFHEGYHPKMEQLHDENKSALEKIINEIGFPTIDKVGKDAYEAAWLVIQHSINHPDFMKRCQRLLQIEVDNDQANPLHLVCLTDRILVFQDQPQLYGTQFDWDENNELNPNIYDNLEKVNERRKSLGLNSLEEQTNLIRENAKKEGSRQPSNYQKKREAYNSWRKIVGWIETE